MHTSSRMNDDLGEYFENGKFGQVVVTTEEEDNSEFEGEERAKSKKRGGKRNHTPHIESEQFDMI